MARVSGFGQTGPYAERAGFGAIGEAMGGLRAVVGDPDRPPVRPVSRSATPCRGRSARSGPRRAPRAPHRRPGTGAGHRPVRIGADLHGVADHSTTTSMAMGCARAPVPPCPGVAPRTSTPRSTDGQRSSSPGNQDKCSDDWPCHGIDPSSQTDERYATHVARGERQRELDGWWRRGRSPLLATRPLHDPRRGGRARGSIYQRTGDAADPHFAAREAHRGRPASDPGPMKMQNVVPRASRTPGASTGRGRSWTPTPTRCSAGPLGLTDDDDRIRRRPDDDHVRAFPPGRCRSPTPRTIAEGLRDACAAASGRPFVPTVYRRLALHPEAFSHRGRPGLPAVVRARAHEPHFVEAELDRSDDALPGRATVAGSRLGVHRPGQTRSASRRRRSVPSGQSPQSPVQSCPSSGVAAMTCRARHHGAPGGTRPRAYGTLAGHPRRATTRVSSPPGLWRELAPAPTASSRCGLAYERWARTVASPGAGCRPCPRRHGASGTGVRSNGSPTDPVDPSLHRQPASASPGSHRRVATMVVEGEWLHLRSTTTPKEGTST